MVGTVLKISPMCSLYKMVVLPAASNPSMTTCQAHESPHTSSAGAYASLAELLPCLTLISLLPNTLSSIFRIAFPIVQKVLGLMPLAA